MKTISKDEKKKGFKHFLMTFTYSYDGLVNAYKKEQSMWIHFVITIIGIILGFWLNISIIEWFFCITFISVAMALELVNTAIEAVVDMTMPDIHPLAKIAKDSASAALLVISIASCIVGGIIFIPKIIAIIGI